MSKENNFNDKYVGTYLLGVKTLLHLPRYFNNKTKPLDDKIRQDNIRQGLYEMIGIIVL